MADTIQKVLDIQVNYSDAIKKLGEYRQELQRCQQEQKGLEKARMSDQISAEQYQQEMAALKIEQSQYTAAIRTLNKEVTNKIKMQGEDKTSLAGMRAELSNLTRQYDNLTKSEREGASGTELRDHIASLTQEIKGNEYATERYWRNVGNYPQTLANTFMDAYASTGKLSEGFKAAGTSVSALGKQLLALLANPIVAVIAAIAVAIMGVVDAFKRNEEQMAKIKEAFAALTPIVNLVKNAFSMLAEGVVILVEGLVSLAEKLGLVTEASKQTMEIERQKMQLERQERANLVKDAETENKVAKLRDKVAQKDKYNTAERRKYLKQAIALEEQQSKRRVAIARKNYQILLAESKLTANDAEMNRKLAEAKAAVIQADTEYYNSTRRLQSQLATFNQEEAKGTSKGTSDRKAALAERAKNEKDAIRAAEDAMLALIKDEAAKQRAQINLQYSREIEDLREKLKTEKNLTARAKDEIRKTIIAKQKQQQMELDKLSDEQLQKDIELRTEQINKMVSLQKKGTSAEYNARRMAAENEYTLAVDKANKEITDKALLNTQLAQLEMQYNQTIDQIDNEEAQAGYDRMMGEIKKRYSGQIEAASNNLLEKAQIQAQESQQEYDAAVERGRLVGETEEQFNARLKALDEKRLADEEEVGEKEKEIKMAKLQVGEAVMNGMQKVFESMGEDNKAFAKLSKVLALGEIAINTGKAIAAGVAQAQSMPFPSNLVAIATTIATITANIASAISTVKSAKFSTGGYVGEEHRYATGGSVHGAGSGTSDSISARLSNGESVLNAAATSMFSPILSAFNQMGGGVPINVASTGSQAMGEDMLARAVARGVASMPSPVVSVEEINKVSNRVNVLESLATI